MGYIVNKAYPTIATVNFEIYRKVEPRQVEEEVIDPEELLNAMTPEAREVFQQVYKPR